MQMECLFVFMRWKMGYSIVRSLNRLYITISSCHQIEHIGISKLVPLIFLTDYAADLDDYYVAHPKYFNATGPLVDQLEFPPPFWRYPLQKKLPFSGNDSSADECRIWNRWYVFLCRCRYVDDYLVIRFQIWLNQELTDHCHFQLWLFGGRLENKSSE